MVSPSADTQCVIGCRYWEGIQHREPMDRRQELASKACRLRAIWMQAGIGHSDFLSPYEDMIAEEV
jgi:hypothetical protein